MKAFVAYTLGLCAVSVTLSLAEPVDARSNRGASGMRHGPVVSHRGSAGHRQGFRSGVTLPRNFRSGVILPRNFRSGVILPRNFRSGVTLPRNFRSNATLKQGFHGGGKRHESRVRRSAKGQRHAGKRHKGFSPSRGERRYSSHRGSHSGTRATKRHGKNEMRARVDKGHTAKKHRVVKRDRPATKHYRRDKPYKAKRKRYEVVDWKPGDRRYRDKKFASAAEKHTGHKRHRGKKRYRIEDWKGKKGHHKAKKRRKHKRHTHVTHIHRHHGFSAGVFYDVPPTDLYVVNAYEEYDDCRRLTELGHDASGRPAKVEWTLCFDEYGEPYVPEGGRHVITSY